MKILKITRVRSAACIDYDIGNSAILNALCSLEEQILNMYNKYIIYYIHHTFLK